LLPVSKKFGRGQPGQRAFCPSLNHNNRLFLWFGANCPLF
jgi:hypothetical protein